MDAERRFQRDAAIITRHIGAETVLVPVRTNTAAMTAIFALNEPAELVWEALAQPTTVASLVQAITQAYAVDSDQANSDVTDLLQQMLELDVVQEVS